MLGDARPTKFWTWATGLPETAHLPENQVVNRIVYPGETLEGYEAKIIA